MAGKQLKDFDSAGTVTDADVFFSAQSGIEKKMTAAQILAYILQSIGSAGNTIRTASGAPANTLGKDGDLYIDSASGLLYQRASGAYGQILSMKGAAGADGNTILSGTGAPAAGLGVISNFYLDTATYNMYGPKTAGGWGTPAALIPTTSGLIELLGGGTWASTASTAGDQTLLSVAIPANAMGPNGNMRVRAKATISGNSGNATTISFRAIDSAGNNLINMAGTFASSNWISREGEIQNMGAQNSQMIQPITASVSEFGTASQTPTTGTVDYSQAQTIKFVANTASTGVIITLKSWAIEIRNP